MAAPAADLTTRQQRALNVLRYAPLRGDKVYGRSIHLTTLRSLQVRGYVTRQFGHKGGVMRGPAASEYWCLTDAGRRLLTGEQRD